MQDITTVSVAGGDTRQIYIAERLEEHGLTVSLFGFDDFGGLTSPRADTLEDALRCDALILPLPCTKNGRTLNAPYAARELPLKELAGQIPKGTVVFAGMILEGFSKELAARGVRVCDYYRDEALTVKNALLTAEGVLGVIIEKTPVTVWRMDAAVTGYGRVGYFICRTLRALGAHVTVYARDPAQRAKAETAGLHAEPLDRMPEQSHRFDVIVNTVPAPVICEDAVANARKDCLFIETASAPYGIDFDACKRHGRELIKAFSQPGKTAPRTAGRIIADTVFGVMKEANSWNLST